MPLSVNAFADPEEAVGIGTDSTNDPPGLYSSRNTAAAEPDNAELPAPTR